MKFQRLYFFSTLNVDNQRELSTNIYSRTDNQRMHDNLDLYNLSLKYKNYNFLYIIKENAIEYMYDIHRLRTQRLIVNYQFDNHSIKFLAKTIKNKSTKTIDTTKNFLSLSIRTKNNFNNLEFFNSARLEFENKAKTMINHDFIIMYGNNNNFISSFTSSINYKKPNFNELFWEPFGNPNLKDEFSRNYYIKNEIYVPFAERLTLNLHYIKFKNLISWRPAAGSNAYWIPDNISSSNSFGPDFYFSIIFAK